jgi:hypothetical protein
MSCDGVSVSSPCRSRPWISSPSSFIQSASLAALATVSAIFFELQISSATRHNWILGGLTHEFCVLQRGMVVVGADGCGWHTAWTAFRL